METVAGYSLWWRSTYNSAKPSAIQTSRAKTNQLERYNVPIWRRKKCSFCYDI